MVSATATPESPISGIRLSSVVPAHATGDGHKDRPLTSMDLALKLHYLKGLYFFQASEAIKGLTIHDFKKPMFPLLALYFTSSGRIRRSDESDPTSRPFLKCNDGGVRIVEACCDELTMEEFMEINDHHQLLDHHLVYDQVLGPDLGFSPLVYIQFTWFKCGGKSVGVSWAHVLGDLFSVSNFMNTWTQLMQADHHIPSAPLHTPPPMETPPSPSPPRQPSSLKQVDPVGDSWLICNHSKMETHSFHVTASQLQNILSQVCHQNRPHPPFCVLSAIVWKLLAGVREGSCSGLETVTICTDRSSRHKSSEPQLPSNNGVVIGVVRADFSSAKGDVHELAGLIAEKHEEENDLIQQVVESDDAKSDYIVYGANLTFANFEGANIYGLELMGQKPIWANCTIKGVGDEGAVLILPGPDGGRTVTVILPQHQVTELRKELTKNWGIYLK